jgi:hypothetical protein
LVVSIIDRNFLPNPSSQSRTDAFGSKVEKRFHSCCRRVTP